MIRFTIGFVVLLLACAEANTPARLSPAAVPLPDYAANWTPIAHDKSQIMLRVPPGIGQLTMPGSAECGAGAEDPGSIDRGADGMVCLTIQNAQLAAAARVDVSITAPRAKRTIAHVGWRVPGGCAAMTPAGSFGYALMVQDTGAIAVGDVGRGSVESAAQ